MRSDRQIVTVRDGTETVRVLTVHALTIRAATAREEDRSIEAVFATEGVVQAFDIRIGDTVDEVLLMGGFQPPPGGQIQLYDSHPEKYGFPTVADVRGAGREMKVSGSELLGRLFFAKDQPSFDAWCKVRDGFVKDVSVGVIPITTVTVRPGESVTVAGRQFTASADRPLFIRTAWTAGEVSVTPVGADPRCKVREAHSGDRFIMSKELRAYLESIGLATTATVREAWTFYGKMTEPQATQAATVRQATDVPPAAETPPANPPAAPPATPPAAPPITETIRLGGASSDDQRVLSIRQRIGDNAERHPELYQQVINDPNCGVERAAELFRVAAVRSRSGPIPPDSAPAAHIRNREAECTTEVLAAAVMLRQNVRLDHPTFATDAMLRGGRPGTLRHAAPWLARPVNDAARQQVMDTAHRFAHLSLPDVCREAVRIDAAAGRRCRDLGGQEINSRDVDLRYGGYEETIRAAVSGSALPAMFSTYLYAELLIAYQDGPDTTVGWVQEDDFDNFQKKQYSWMGKMGQLTKHARGKQDAGHLDTSDHSEEAQIDRYVGQFVCDEMDLLDNRFQNLQSDSPRDMGLVARQLRPNLVYSALLANPNLSDGEPVFDGNGHSTRGNDGNSVAFAADAVKAAITAIETRRERDRILDLKPRFLICCKDLEWLAEITLQNRLILASTPVDGGTVVGGQDPLVKRQLQIVTDDRLGAAGVTDPNTGTHYTGGTGTWFLSCKAGEQGAKTLIVGYRRGTGRAPVARGFILDRGQWGMGWDINLDIGVAWLDGRAVYRGKVG